VALVVGGVALALGGAALFAIVAHTRTPWSTQRIVGLVPLDSLAPADFVVPLPSVALKGKRPAAVPVEPPPAPTQMVAAPPASMPPATPDSLSQGESVVVLPKPSPIEPKAVETQVVQTAPTPSC
jgi:hypothetical protein